MCTKQMMMWNLSENTSQALNEEVIDYFEDRLLLKVIFCGSIIASQCFAFALYPCIILYETRAGDPLKRTVLNQIVSMLGCYVIAGNIVLGNAWLFRVVFGPISFQAAKISFFIPKSILTMSSLLAGMEYIVIRYLTYCVWQGPAPINEQFFGRTVSLINCVVTTFLGLVQNYGKLADRDLLYAFIGRDQTNDEPVFK